MFEVVYSYTHTQVILLSPTFAPPEELYLPFASLWAFVSKKTDRPALVLSEALKRCMFQELVGLTEVQNPVETSLAI